MVQVTVGGSGNEVTHGGVIDSRPRKHEERSLKVTFVSVRAVPVSLPASLQCERLDWSVFNTEP